VDGFSTAAAALAGQAHVASASSTSGRAFQTYALTVLFGVVFDGSAPHPSAVRLPTF